ncbi:MAG: glycosyltransferase family 4 protein [Lysobacteraceae bacterium]
MDADLPLLVVLPLVTAASVLFSWLALVYARRRALLDVPGERRSHTTATPRGGGIGPVMAWLLSAFSLGGVLGEPVSSAGWLLLSTVLVAAISWIDDHRSLPILPRVAVHLLAAGLLVFGIMGLGDGIIELAQRLLLVFALLLAINFWNFMDGIDGIAVMQSSVSALLLATAAWMSGSIVSLLLALLLFAALLGFAPFNLPRARIFLGDVGSTSLGFVLAGVAVLGFADGRWGWALWPIIAAPFLMDAGLTLLSRLLRGARWYTPHREHLYQWLHRSGLSHPRIVAIYLACNLLFVVPAVLLLLRHPAWWAWLWAGQWLLLALVWLLARRWLSTRLRSAE